MLKKILLALVFVITAITNVAHAEDDMKTVASKAYVDTKIETKQLKIPAANTPGVGEGETVMTYTANGNGEIGERGLYSDASNYNPNTDGDKLITASALNDTFTNLPTKDTTKLECANPGTCDLWAIVDQTAYGRPSRNLLDETNMIRSGTVANAYMVAYTSGNNSGLPRIELQSGTTYTLSFDIETNVFPYEISVGCGQGNYARDIQHSGYIFTGNGRVSITFTPTDSQLSYGNVFAFRAPRYSQPESFTYSISNIQLELGDTATPYEPYH